jgi:arylsulfatase A-like enzyme
MTKVSRRGMLATVGGTAVSLAAPRAFARPAKTASPPNIIFIMADDLGYADLGCYGARTIKTPNLDRLAAQGLRLTDGYSNSPVCSATRTGLITGRYQYRFRCGLEEPIALANYGLPADTPTLPSHMRQLGYTTSLVGKWHLGSLPEYSPLKNGYDRFFGIQEGGADYFTHRLTFGSVTSAGLIDGAIPIERHGYLTDLLGAKAIEEVELAAAQKRPMMLSLHFTAPHWPWEGPEDEHLSKHIANPQHPDGGNLATYARMVENMDENIGKLLSALERLGIADNTIVIFTSDNGGERFSDTWPFIGAKTELLEGGIRVPLIVRWPAAIAAGTTSPQVMISMDFVPTLLAAAGAGPALLSGFDGENLLDVLTGKAEPRQRTLFWRYKAGNQAAVREGDWKYLKILNREWLFNLAQDQHERANLSKREPKRFADLKAKYEAWNATMLPYPSDSATHSISEMLADRYLVD